jgi:signal transduction histidine kinase
MSYKETRIVLVEDDPMFSQMIQFQLTSSGSDFNSGNIQHVMSLNDFEEILAFFLPDVILLDLNLPDSMGLDTYMRVKNKCPNCAIIILSGSDDEELSAKIVQNGAQDYILKSDVNGRLLNKAIHYSLERMRQQVVLSESERKFRSVFENSPIPMLTVRGSNFAIQMANKAFSNLYEGQLGAFYNKSLADFKCRKDDDLVFDMGLSRMSMELCQLTLEGNQIHVELIANKLNIESDLYICQIIDKTDELRFQQEKMKLIHVAQENEKHKIAREIHDGLAQNLVLMNLLFESFEFPSELKDQRTNFAQLIKSTIDEARGISYSLLPPELESGFLHGIRHMINRINNLKTQKVHFSVEDDVLEEDFDQVDRFNLFRIMQEFINNSVKYSQSEHIDVSFSKDETGIVKIVIDDHGVGFDMNQSKGTLGISNMMDRIKIANLEGNIVSEIGRGTILEIYFQSILTNK